MIIIKNILCLICALFWVYNMNMVRRAKDIKDVRFVSIISSLLSAVLFLYLIIT